MLLFHGSNMKVDKPKLMPNLQALDFGAGFYLTSSKEQAKKWARTVAKRRNMGQEIVNVYSFNEDFLQSLNVLTFPSADGKWLEYVVANRSSNMGKNDYDIVVGPVANDFTLSVIDDCMANKYTKEEAVKRLLPQNLTDQYAFLSEKAIKLLEFVEEEVL